MNKRDQMKGGTTALKRIKELNAATLQEDWHKLDQIFRKQLIMDLNVRGYSASDELAQETFLRAFQKIDTFKGKTTREFMNWLLSVAKNLRKDRNKKAQRTVDHTPLGGTEALEFVNQVPANAQSAGSQIREKIVSILVAQIKSEFEDDTNWQCFELMVINQYSSTEAAKQLGITDKHVRTRKKRMLTKIQNKFPELMNQISQATELISEYQDHPDWPTLELRYFDDQTDTQIGKVLGLKCEEVFRRRLLVRKEIESNFPGILNNILEVAKKL